MSVTKNGFSFTGVKWETAGHWLVGALALSLVVVIAVPAGALLLEMGFGPVVRVVGIAKHLYHSTHPRPSRVVEIETTLIKLQIDQNLAVPAAARGVGGGLTSFGPELVLVNNDGAIFVEVGGHVTPTEIRAPDNHFAAYAKAAAKLSTQGYVFDLEYLRYNDINLFETPSNRYLLVSYIDWIDESSCFRNAVARLKLLRSVRSLSEVLAQPADWEVIAHTEPCLPIKKISRALEGHMAGGRMTRLGPTSIALTSGDFGWDGVFGPFNIDPASTIPLAQDPNAEYGKVLAIDVETGRKRTISIGNRNMQGIATTADGALWTVEHGPRGGDELNRAHDGANFGWPLQTYGTQYSGLPWPGALPYGRHDKFDPPVFAWVPSAAVSGLTRVNGFAPAWDDDLLVGSLATQSLYRVRISDGRVVFVERIPIGFRVRAVHQHSDNRIVLWTDDFRLVYLTCKAGSMTYEFAERTIEQSGLPANTQLEVRTELLRCVECHSLDGGNDERAPSLAGVWGRRVGATPYSGYSKALIEKGGVWDRASLDAFIADAQAFAPGTRMPNPNIANSAVRAELVRVLEKIATTPE
jgi:cytochrome c2